MQRPRPFSSQRHTIAHMLVASALCACGSLGSDPDENTLRQLRLSPQFDVKNEIFLNTDNAAIKRMEDRMDFWTMIKIPFQTHDESRPRAPLPTRSPSWPQFLKDEEDRAQVIWFGHSTFMVRVGQQTVLVDPIFSKAASPFGGFVHRFQAPVVPLDQLPPVDVILISHDHYDHLDYETVLFFKGTQTRFVVPLGVDAHLLGWGIPPDRITALGWWSQTDSGSLSITCAPAQHFSGRGLLNRNTTLWAGWSVRERNSGVSFFYSGDSGYNTHFAEIGKRLGPFDLNLLENGQYNPLWREVHMLPEETVQAHLDLGGKWMLPVHWGLFVLSTHSWFEPIERALRAATARKATLSTPIMGEIQEFGPGVSGGMDPSALWWRSSVPEGQLQNESPL